MLWTGIAQSVKRLATGWTVRGSEPGRGEIFRTCVDALRPPPSFLLVIQKGWNGKGVAQTTKSHLASRLKKAWSYNSASPHAFMTGYRMTFTWLCFTFLYVCIKQNRGYDVKILHLVFIMFLEHQNSKVHSLYHSTDTSEQNGCQNTSEQNGCQITSEQNGCQIISEQNCCQITSEKNGCKITS